MLLIGTPSAIRTEVIDSLRNFLDEHLSIDISNITKENVKAIQQVLPDFELREGSRSLSVVGDVISGTDSAFTHFQLLQRLILANDEEYRPVIVALARILAAKPHSMEG